MSSIPRIELSMSCHMLSWIAGVLRKLPEIFMALRQHPLRSHHPLALAALAFLFHGRPRRNEAGSETSHLMPNKAIAMQLSGMFYDVLLCFAVFTSSTIEFGQAKLERFPADYVTCSYILPSYFNIFHPFPNFWATWFIHQLYPIVEMLPAGAGDSGDSAKARFRHLAWQLGVVIIEVRI